MPSGDISLCQPHKQHAFSATFLPSPTPLVIITSRPLLCNQQSFVLPTNYPRRVRRVRNLPPPRRTAERLVKPHVKRCTPQNRCSMSYHRNGIRYWRNKFAKSKSNYPSPARHVSPILTVYRDCPARHNSHSIRRGKSWLTLISNVASPRSN